MPASAAGPKASSRGLALRAGLRTEPHVRMFWNGLEQGLCGALPNLWLGRGLFWLPRGPYQVAVNCSVRCELPESECSAPSTGLREHQRAGRAWAKGLGQVGRSSFSSGWKGGKDKSVDFLRPKMMPPTCAMDTKLHEAHRGLVGTSRSGQTRRTLWGELILH